MGLPGETQAVSGVRDGDAVALLRAAISDALSLLTVYGEHMPPFMHGEPLKAHVKRLRSALAQTVRA